MELDQALASLRIETSMLRPSFDADIDQALASLRIETLIAYRTSLDLHDQALASLRIETGKSVILRCCLWIRLSRACGLKQMHDIRHF